MKMQLSHIAQVRITLMSGMIFHYVRSRYYHKHAMITTWLDASSKNSSLYSATFDLTLHSSFVWFGHLMCYYKYLGIVTIFSSMQCIGRKMYNVVGVCSS